MEKVTRAHLAGLELFRDCMDKILPVHFALLLEDLIDQAKAAPDQCATGYMPIPTAEQLAEALENVGSFHDMSAELIAPELLANLLAALSQQGESAPAQDERWAVHAQGPDELYAAFSREDAEQHAAALNTLSMPAGIQVSAIVVESPWPAAEHWKYLAEQERDHVAELRAGVNRPHPAQTEQQPVQAVHIGWDYLDDGTKVATFLVRCSGNKPPKLYAAPVANAAPQKDVWISVEDRLPEARNGTRYLVARDCGNGTLKSTSVGFLLGGEWHASDDVRSFRDMGYRVTHWQLLPAAPGELGDAYQGAREDLAIWKRRALEAEQKVRQQEQIIDHLTLEAQGETRMGEPVIPHTTPQPERVSVPRELVQRAARHLNDWLELDQCECEGPHYCGRTQVAATNRQLRALLATHAEIRKTNP